MHQPLLRLLPLLSLFAAPPLAAQDPLPKDRARGAATVDVAACRRWLGELAGPEFQGRGTGTEGYRKAAEFVAAHFRALGLEARGEDGSYYQHVPWTEAKVTAAELVFRDGEREVLRVPKERLSGSASTDVAVEGPVLLLDVDVPERSDDDARRVPEIEGLDAVDVEGKVVVAHVRGNRRDGPWARFAVQQALQGKAPAALLFATDDAVEGEIRGRSGAGRRGGNPAAAARGRTPLALSFGGDDLARLRAAAGPEKEQDRRTLARQLPLTASVRVGLETKDAPAMNVFAVLPGTDPQLAGEYVVIGSHLDHLGEQRGVVHPGADDDGSGTTGVMAVAQMFAKNPTKPRRSILFVCFAGEESGLQGSRWFVANCPVPLSSIVAELQMDMIGRDEEEAMDGRRRVNVGEKAEQNRNSLHLVGTEQLSKDLHELCLARNERARLDLEFDQESLFRRSDHFNFAKEGVPIAFFFTGLHADYHRPSDTADKIHYEKLLRVARYVYDIGFELATRDERPKVDLELWRAFRESLRNQAPEQPAAPLREPAAKRNRRDR